MRLYYFIVDDDGQLRRTGRRLVEALWQGQCLVSELNLQLSETLRLVTVLCDDDFTPMVTYFVRLDLADGQITDESRIAAFEAMTIRGRHRDDHASAQKQFAGWPSDWQRQLAIALDVTPDCINKLGVGGPLLLSDLWGVPLAKVLAYFEEAAGD